MSKKVIDEVIIDGSTGAPSWLQPLVNKALRDGIDNTKGYAYKDAQVVRTLDTPTGKVDVYYDVRTGEVEIEYIGSNTALGESVNMRYTPGIADEGTKGKPADEFEATEAIPEGRRTGPDDYDIDMGENTVGDVKGLFSDTTELAELGGQKPLIKDISDEQPLLFLPSDHLLEKNFTFNRMIKKHKSYLDKKNIFIFGIKPSVPSSEYGYFLSKKKQC